MQLTDLQLAKRFVAKANSSFDRGIGFTISLTSYRNLMQAKRCYYTGIELVDEPGKPNSRTIDRIDHKKPYEKGNVVACCHGFNQMKAALEATQAIGMVDFQKGIAKMFNAINTVRDSKVKITVVKGK